MSKRVLDVGNCGPDLAAIKGMLSRRFGCEVLQAHGASDALAALRAGGIDLVLVNRKLDADYSDGIDVIRQIKADPTIGSTPVMLITNYAEHQDAAEKIGALRGFGKLELGKPGDDRTAGSGARPRPRMPSGVASRVHRSRTSADASTPRRSALSPAARSAGSCRSWSARRPSCRPASAR